MGTNFASGVKFGKVVQLLLRFLILNTSMSLRKCPPLDILPT